MWKSVLIFVFIVVPIMKVLADNYAQNKLDADVAKSVEEGRKELPKIINNAIRVDNISYANRTVRYEAVVLAKTDIDDSRKAAFQDGIKEMYCHGGMQPYARANVSVEYSIRFESVFYKNIEWPFKLVPADCAPPKKQ